MIDDICTNTGLFAQIAVLLELLEQTTLWKVCQTLRLVLNEKADMGEKRKQVVEFNRWKLFWIGDTEMTEEEMKKIYAGTFRRNMSVVESAHGYINTRNIRSREIRDILKSFYDQIDKINRESRKVYMVNAGTMNHGKSSLFNSLLGRDLFKVQDIRTTVTCAENEYKPGVYLVDTPGLSANKQDDTEAMKAYRKASAIVFVHNPRVGELHKEEIDWINRMRQELGQAYFEKHLFVVLTFFDEFLDDKEGLNRISGKIKDQLRHRCGLTSDVPTFAVSNSIYKKGTEENKPKLVEASGFKDFRSCLDRNIPTWIKELQPRKRKQIENAKRDAMRELDAMKHTWTDRLREKKAKTEKYSRRFADDVGRVSRNLEELSSEVENLAGRYDQAVQEARSCEQRHRDDRAEFDKNPFLYKMRRRS